jgi:hypothetical protein
MVEVFSLHKNINWQKDMIGCGTFLFSNILNVVPNCTFTLNLQK